MGPEGLHDLSFALQPAASGRDPEIMAITEEWGDQPSWKTGADLGTSILFSFSTSTGRAVPSHNMEFLFLTRV